MFERFWFWCDDNRGFIKNYEIQGILHNIERMSLAQLETNFIFLLHKQ